LAPLKLKRSHQPQQIISKSSIPVPGEKAFFEELARKRDYVTLSATKEKAYGLKTDCRTETIKSQQVL